MDDYGKSLNASIKAARLQVDLLQQQLSDAEYVLDTYENERKEAREECHFCNDCSMCIP